MCCKKIFEILDKNNKKYTVYEDLQNIDSE